MVYTWVRFIVCLFYQKLMKACMDLCIPCNYYGLWRIQSVDQRSVMGNPWQLGSWDWRGQGLNLGSASYDRALGQSIGPLWTSVLIYKVGIIIPNAQTVMKMEWIGAWSTQRTTAVARTAVSGSSAAAKVFLPPIRLQLDLVAALLP